MAQTAERTKVTKLMLNAVIEVPPYNARTMWLAGLPEGEDNPPIEVVSVAAFAEMLSSLSSLLEVGYWAAWANFPGILDGQIRDVRGRPVIHTTGRPHNPKRALAHSVELVSLRYSSPAEIWALLNPYGMTFGLSTAIVAARGLIYLRDQYQNSRRNKSEVDLAVATNKLLRAALPTVEEVEARRQKEGDPEGLAKLPSDEEISAAASIVPRINVVQLYDLDRRPLDPDAILRTDEG